MHANKVQSIHAVPWTLGNTHHSLVCWEWTIYNSTTTSLQGFAIVHAHGGSKVPRMYIDITYKTYNFIHNYYIIQMQTMLSQVRISDTFSWNSFQKLTFFLLHKLHGLFWWSRTSASDCCRDSIIFIASRALQTATPSWPSDIQLKCVPLFGHFSRDWRHIK